MNFNEAVDAIDGRVRTWVDTCKPLAADAKRAEYRASLVMESTRSGVLLASEDRLDAATDAWSREFDRDADAEGRAIDLDVDLLAQRIASEVAAYEPLPRLSQRYAGDRAVWTLVDTIGQSEARKELEGLTRSQVLDRYESAKDDQDDSNALLRLIEDAVLMGGLDRLSLKSDPDHDVFALPRLQKLVQTRRAARVPESVQKAAAQLATVRSLQFSETLRHLKAGKGLAFRPRPRAVGAA